MQIIMMSYVSLIHVNGHILMGSYQNLSVKTKLNPIICLYYWTIGTNGSNYDCKTSHFIGGCDALSSMLQPFLSQFNLMRKRLFFLPQTGCKFSHSSWGGGALIFAFPMAKVDPGLKDGARKNDSLVPATQL